MVKLTGPGQSVAASGSLADEVTFSHWKGAPYLKVKRNPRQPRSAEQIAMRAAMTFLSPRWTELARGDQLSWDDTAAELNVTSPNAYLAVNLARFRSWNGPTQAFPATDTGSGGNTQNRTATAIGKGLLLGFDPWQIAQNWGYIIYHSTVGWPVRNWDTILWMPKGHTLDRIERVFSPLSQGTHYFRIDSFTDTGKITGLAQTFSGVVP